MTPEEKKVFEQMREALEELADALPMHESTVKTCYAIDNRHRDNIHMALTAANAVSEPVGINGITEAETNATMSVIGLSQPQPQACKDCGQSTKQDLIHTCSPQVAKPEQVETDQNYGGWVPMAERLPPTEVPILVCAYDGTVTAAVFEHTPSESWISWGGAGFGGYEWDWDWDASISRPWRGVTHWMPLPPAPEAA